MSTKLISKALILFGLMISNAFACQAVITDVYQTDTSEEYDVFESSSYGLRQNYTLKYEIGTDCFVHLEVTTVNEIFELSSIYGDSLKFNVSGSGTTQGAKYKSPSVSNTSESLIEGEYTFELRYPSSQFLQASRFENLLVAKLVDSVSGANVYDKELVIRSYIEPTSSVYFSGISGQLTRVKLGTLTTGKVINHLPKLRVVSTSPYLVSFSSYNEGRLLHETNHQEWAVDYEFRVNGQPIYLDQGEQIWRSKDITTYLGSLLDLSMTIGNTEERPAGKYKDTIEIVVRPELVLSP